MIASSAAAQVDVSAKGAIVGAGTFVVAGAEEDLPRRLKAAVEAAGRAAGSGASPDYVVELGFVRHFGNVGAYVPDQATIAGDRPNWVVAPDKDGRQQLHIYVRDLRTGAEVYRASAATLASADMSEQLFEAASQRLIEDTRR